MSEKEPKHDDDFMENAVSVSKGSGKWQPKKGRPKKREDIHTVNVDLTLDMLQKIDDAATYLNVSRQAVIKNFCLEGLTKHEKQLEKKVS